MLTAWIDFWTTNSSIGYNDWIDARRDRSIMSIVHNLWWQINVLWKDKRYIRKWWETYNNRRFIEVISPDFLFSEDEKWQFHSMYVIEILFQ